MQPDHDPDAETTPLTLPLATGAAPAAPRDPFRVVLVSTYELGRQPFGIASPAAWLRESGAEVRVFDLSLQDLDDDAVRAADLIAFYVPMHTATRIAIGVIAKVTTLNPDAHLCAYGLYAPMNEELLRELGIDTIIGGEFEESLVELADALRTGAASDVVGGRVVTLARQQFKVPDRTGLPGLNDYACLQLPGGDHRVVGYTEATRGCKHLCRHCPIVPIYHGRFRAVQKEVVLEDVRRQVEAGAEHVTFGDPDFFNGPGHALRVVEALHEAFPTLTYDVTIKVEHLRKHEKLLPDLERTGCLFVTSAVESFDENILEIFDKQHTREDFESVVAAVRRVGLGFNPTFVAFTPWTSMDVYVDFLTTIHGLDLVGNVAPIQYAIRLLIPEGSRLLELPETHTFITHFDRDALCHRWRHPDPRMDALQREIQASVEAFVADRKPREEIFREVCALTAASAEAEQRVKLLELDHGPPRELVPYLTEPWYC